MNIILDTHILILFLEDNKRLRNNFLKMIIDPKNTIYFSSVSIAEMAIKASKNKLQYPDDIINICVVQGFKELELKSQHCILLKVLPYIHFDPFDRLLIVQAQSEDFYLMSEDKIFRHYELKMVK